MDIELSENYKQVLQAVKARVQQAQYAALRAVNTELIQLYWDIGRIIVEKQAQHHWGDNIVEQLAHDLQVEIPGIRGFSLSNVWRMRSFYLTYKDTPKLAQLVREIGWSHNVVIMERCKDELEREFYLKLTSQNGWSRAALIENITHSAYQRFLENQTNFRTTVPQERRAKALLAVKDEYNFDFIQMRASFQERELEEALVTNITKFLAEMGGYFAFVGRQFRVEIKEKEFFIDLLFYHRRLRSLVAVELKAGEFEPEYAGKMQFYLTALNETVRLEGEHPSIGIIICKEKDRTIVEYTLKNVHEPIGVATYKTYSTLDDIPEKIAKYLPSPTELEKRLTDEIE